MYRLTYTPGTITRSIQRPNNEIFSNGNEIKNLTNNYCVSEKYYILVCCIIRLTVLYLHVYNYS